MIFSGHGGLKQKQQLQVMDNFRSGKINVLIATCVAEEGIDVGEIDFIICFDISTKNPTRLVQRIGRTGRRREGTVLMLVTEGKEQSILKEVLATKDSTNKQIMYSTEISDMMYKSPRLIPMEFNPKCIEVFIKIENKNALAADLERDLEITTVSISVFIFRSCVLILFLNF